MADYSWLWNTEFTPVNDNGTDVHGHTKDEDDAIRRNALREMNQFPTMTPAWQWDSAPVYWDKPEQEKIVPQYSYGDEKDKEKNNWTNPDRSDEKYWDEANKQVVNNRAMKDPEFASYAYNNGDINQGINWGELENRNFWDSSNGLNIYKDNGVTYGSVMGSGHLDPEDINNIRNRRMLAQYGPSRNGDVNDWYSRNTSAGEKFTDTDKNLFKAQIGGIDSIKNVDPALYSQLQSSLRTDDKHGGKQMLEGEDYTQMEYGYNPDTQKMEGDDWANGMTIDSLANELIENPDNLNEVLYSNPAQIFSRNAGNDIYGLNTITSKMADAGLSLKNPNGVIGLDVGNQVTSPSGAKRFVNEQAKLLKKKENPTEADQQTLEHLEQIAQDAGEARGIINANLNTAILAAAAAEQNPALAYTDVDDTRKKRKEALNNFLYYPDVTHGYSGNAFDYIGEPDNNAKVDINKLLTKTDTNYLTTNKTGDLNWEEIAKALSRSGIRPS